MTGPVLHPKTEAAITRFAAKPSHAVLLVAPQGAGKLSVARLLAAQLLNTSPDTLAHQGHFKQVSPVDGKSISIERARDVTRFLMLKAPGRQSVARVVIIEDAETLTSQAQNALLKTIEEPPTDTVLILTAPSEQAILPTIRSRVQVLPVQLPDASALRSYFVSAGYVESAATKALLMSAGLPGLCSALLADDISHPLVAAAARARDILQKTAFERLAMTDDLTKDKQAWLDTLSMLERMAQVSLQGGRLADAAVRRWYGVMNAAHEAYGKSAASAQTKLVALNFMLHL